MTIVLGAGNLPADAASPRPGPGGTRPTVVGLDLAWGARARTGIAIVDASGRLVQTAGAVSDAEIDELVGPWIAGPCLVAIDAPLVVRNATGRRPCEAALSRAFAPQHAGTYPSNTSLPAFADGGRAAGFARRHGLDPDATKPLAGPGETGQRRAIEAFPHSATVALFHLPYVLAYKARQGRSLESRRAELRRLVDLLATLEHRTPGPSLTPPDGYFAEVRSAIADAPTGAALRRLEDPLDAVVCAYVGMLFLAGQACVVGDGETGAIVTPVDERHRPLLITR